ncbi:RNA recognition motif domain-containing protein [Mucilaginibacter sp. X4EP1]|uniref:RNA recognition motif domain-containing protein n=1 Tax=Mucilaginibacter sp. X4EP1 TaxID=2723092 RepID=UPI0021686BBD|nr:RNA-binding protein [Mucilaginibacter sp. X4EP1]MCS3812051.1 RNA recognition motif-containing protein [Mucilaginibacter sp. X4EP1]
MAKLFIVGFPKDMQEIELVEQFSAHGTVNTVTIVTDKNSGDSKGYGFITMTDDAGAERAILAMDGVKIGERTISVRLAEEKQPVKTTASPRLRQKGQAAPLRHENRTEAPRPKRPRRPL